MTYSADFRERVLTIQREEKLTYHETADRFRVGIATLIRWNGGFEPKNTRHRRPSKIHDELLRQDTVQYPDSFQYERAERLGVSRRGVCSALNRLGLTRKKKLPAP